MKKIILCLAIAFIGLTCNSTFGQSGWFLQTNPTSDSGESMQFVSATEGWISLTSNQLLHTTNAGTTWSIVTPNLTDVTSGMDAPGSRISFINTTTGWAFKTLGSNNTPVGAVLYKTNNGGSTWSRTVLSTTSVDANNGWAHPILIIKMEQIIQA